MQGAAVQMLLVALCLISTTASRSGDEADKHHSHQHHKDLISAAAHKKGPQKNDRLPKNKHHHKRREDEGTHHMPKADSDMSMSDGQKHHRQGSDADTSLLEGKHRHTSTAGLALHKRPSPRAPVVGYLDQGSFFEVSSAQEDKDGAVWLELADHSGWVPQDKVLQVPDKKSRHNRRRFSTNSQEKANRFGLALAEKAEPDKKSDSYPMHMDQSKLPPKIKHVNHKTINADWHNEYPVTPDPIVTPKDSALRLTSLGSTLAWLLIMCWGMS